MASVRQARVLRYPRPAATASAGLPAAAREGGPGTPSWAGLSPECFAFLAELAAHNTREWFHEHAGAFAAVVERPWHGLLRAVAPTLEEWLPDLETGLHHPGVLSRMPSRWPRPGATYQTTLRAHFAPRGHPRPPAVALTVRLEPSGVRAATEVRAGTAEWAAALAGARDRRWTRLAGPGQPEWTLNGRPVPPLDVAARMEGAGRRAVLALGATWDAARAADLGAALGRAVREALWASLPLYLAASGTAARPAPEAPDPAPAEADGAPLPRLPIALQRRLAAEAERQGVSLEAWIVFALTRAALGTAPVRRNR